MKINISIDNIKFRQILLFDNPIAKKYYSLVKKLVSKNGLDFDHRRSFYSYKTTNEIKNDLNTAITFINNFLQKELLPTKQKLTQEYFNKIHTVFETLNQGYDDDPILKLIATPDLAESIRDINFCVHQLEHGRIKKQVQIQWNKETTERVALDNEDYYHATDKWEINYVYLGYNEVGKNILDIYHDNLSIDYPGLKNNHFVGPDIVFSTIDRPLFDKKFVKWCSNNSINAFDSKNGIWNYPIGTFKTFCSEDNFGSDSKITAYDFVDKL